MKKLLVLIAICSLVGGASLLLHADEGPASPTMKSDLTTYRLEIGNKVARGVGNCLYGWTELPKRIVGVTQESNNPIWGLFAGGFQGTLKAMARTFSGISDIATAPITPEKPPLMQPDIAVE